MQVYLVAIFLFLFVYKVESTARTVGVEDCVPSSSKDVIDEIKSLKRSYTCTGIERISQIINSIPHDTEEVIVTNSNIIGDKLNDGNNNRQNFSSLQSLSIVESFVGAPFMEWMGSLEQLQHLTLEQSANSYMISHEDINLTVLDLKLTPFKNLKRLQISKSNITDLEIYQSTNIPILDLSDNKFECGHDFIWLLRLHDSTNRVYLNNTICFVKKSYENVKYHILYTLREKPFIPVMDYKREAIDHCPPKCVCGLQGMLSVERPTLNVDCIGLNMSKLPDVIPRGSSRCNFSFNVIEDLTPLYTNRAYEKVAMMVLSHNHIFFLDPVQFPNLLRKRRDTGFCLDHNRLTKFPAETVKKVYDEAYEKDRFMPQFFLGHNPWICSCDYIADFQKLIYQHMYDIFDDREIRCSSEDPYNPGMLVLALDVGTLCDKEPVMNTLDFINIFLAILLLALIVDFIHNYRQYRKSRKLPWIVTVYKC